LANREYLGYGGRIARLALVLALAFALAATLPAAATATTGSVAGGVLTIADGTSVGVPDDIVVSPSGVAGEVNVIGRSRDSDLTPGAGCSAVAPSFGFGTDTIRCTGVTASLTITLGAENDVLLTAVPLPANVNGGVGNDEINALSETNDTLNGGNGVDTVSYDFRSNGVTVDLETTAANVGSGGRTGSAEADSLSNFENLTGPSDAPSTLTGNTSQNTITGGNQSDVIDGDAGGDRILSVRRQFFSTQVGGNDTVSGGNDGAGDTLDFSAVDATHLPADVNMATGQALVGNSAGVNFNGFESVTGSASDDVFRPAAGSPTTFIGGEGNDAVNYSAHTLAVIGTMQAPVQTFAQLVLGSGPGATAHTLVDVEDFVGGSGADNIDLGRKLVGLGGNDNLRGGKEMYGGAGDDQLGAGTNSPTLQGGEGVDTASYGNRSAVTVDLRTGLAEAKAGPQTDVLGGIENVVGSSGDDTLIGDDGANVLDGANGNDTIVTRDLVQDSAICGAGAADVARTDPLDTVSGCESELEEAIDQPQGPPGADGAKGDPGPAGPPGPTGPAGPPGLGATSIVRAAVGGRPRLRAARRGGIPVTISVTEATRVNLTVTHGSRRLGTKTATLRSGSNTVRVKLSASTARLLARRRSIRLKLTIEATGPGGSTANATQTFTLRR
jgi:RTX calcium-binding nonapeptide repeat (4 copies)